MANQQLRTMFRLQLISVYPSRVNDLPLWLMNECMAHRKALQGVHLRIDNYRQESRHFRWGAGDAGLENTGTITHGQPSEENTIRYQYTIPADCSVSYRRIRLC